MVRLITIALLLSGLMVNAQSIRTYSLSPAGASVNQGGYKMLWQIGGITKGASSNKNSTIFQDYFTTAELVTITSIDSQLSEKISCFPNPASEFINVRLIENKNRTYRLFDARGNEMSNTWITHFDDIDRLEIKELTNGLYILHINVEGNPKPIQIKILKR